MNYIKFWPFLMFFCITINAQQLDKIGKKGGIQTTGGLSFSNQFYHVNGESNVSTPPYYYMLSGNVNVNVYGWSLPFSLSYSNRKFVTGQPSNVVGVSPTYKNLTLHAGVRSLTFSPYTLAGHTFTGGGIEYNWKATGLSFKAMGGQLLRAVNYDPNDKNIVPTYARNAGGFMVDYTKEGNNLQFIVFYAKDQRNSINPLPDSLLAVRNIAPQENLVYSLGFKKSLNQMISLYAELAMSAWVKNMNGYDVNAGAPFIKPLFAIKEPSKAYYYNAYKIGADFNFKVATLGLGFDHVDPDFYTLGSYFVANDFENITLNGSTGFLKNKIRLTARGGLQKNDLNGKKTSTNNQFTSGLSVTVSPTERLQLAASYNGFNSITRIKSVEEQFLQTNKYYYIDTANIVQLSDAYNGSVNYKLSEDDRSTHSIGATGNYQTAYNKQSDRRFGNDMVNTGLSYNIMFKKTGISLGFMANGNQNEYEQGSSRSWGLGFSASARAFQKKVQISLSANNSNNYEGSAKTATLFSVVNGYSYTLAKQHNFNFNLRYAGRRKLANAAYSMFNSNVNEYFVNLTYSYSFSLTKKSS